MFRKRKNVDVEMDVFTFQQNKIIQTEKDGCPITRTIRPMVTNLDVEFESVTPMPLVSECLRAGISLKEVPTEGILDSPDNLDYNADDADEKILEKVNHLVEEQEKSKKSIKKTEEV